MRKSVKQKKETPWLRHGVRCPTSSGLALELSRLASRSLQLAGQGLVVADLLRYVLYASPVRGPIDRAALLNSTRFPAGSQPPPELVSRHGSGSILMWKALEIGFILAFRGPPRAWSQRSGRAKPTHTSLRAAPARKLARHLLVEFLIRIIASPQAMSIARQVILMFLRTLE